jgi:hypothetical protein
LLRPAQAQGWAIRAARESATRQLFNGRTLGRVITMFERHTEAFTRHIHVNHGYRPQS